MDLTEVTVVSVKHFSKNIFCDCVKCVFSDGMLLGGGIERFACHDISTNSL